MPFGSRRRQDEPDEFRDTPAAATPLDYFFSFDGPALEDLRLNALDMRIRSVLSEFVEKVGFFAFSLSAGYASADHPFRPGIADVPSGASVPSATELVKSSFTPLEPLYDFGQLVLPEKTMNKLLDVAFFVESSRLVFDEWNLRSIEPRPSMAVNFRGPPGTGKTMAAHALASHLKRKILLCRLSDLESKFHGEGPKNLVELFGS